VRGVVSNGGPGPDVRLEGCQISSFGWTVGEVKEEEREVVLTHHAANLYSKESARWADGN
jgi:hypothetical protein